MIFIKLQFSTTNCYTRTYVFQFIDLRLTVLGNVDSGKSTLLGVLTHGELDNGRGRSRLNLFRHLHEIQTGRTSCISHEIVGFNSKGEVRFCFSFQTSNLSCSIFVMNLVLLPAFVRPLNFLSKFSVVACISRQHMCLLEHSCIKHKVLLLFFFYQ